MKVFPALLLALCLFAATAGAETWSFKFVATGNGPSPAIVDPSTGYTFITGRVPNRDGSFTVTVFDTTNTLIATVKLDGTPSYYGLYPISQASHELYVPIQKAFGSVTVDAISTTTFKVRPITVAGITQANVAAYNPNDETVFVLGLKSDGLHLIRLKADDSIQTDILLFTQDSAEEILFEPVNNLLYVVANLTGIYVVDPVTLNVTLISGYFSNSIYTGAILSIPDGTVYISSNGSTNTITVLSRTQVLASIALKTNVAGLGFSSTTQEVYVAASYNGGQVYRIKGTNLVSTTPTAVGRNPITSVYNPQDGNMYIVDGVSGNAVYVLGSNDATVTKIKQLTSVLSHKYLA